MQSVNKDSFLSLVRMGIGHSSAHPDVDNWPAIKALADRQGLTAIIVDGIEQLPNTKRPPKDLLLQWIGEVFQIYEHRHGLYQRAITELAGWYNTHGYKMMVLKGYACSINWPKPEHRPCGDIDIWLFGKQKEADALLAQEKGVMVDASHHHHTVFDWCGFSVENHYDFVNVYAEKSSKNIEPIFKQLGENDSYTTELNKEKIYLPSPNLHALFLLRHMVSHFASTELTLRQILDWAFFLKAHSQEIDLNWFLATVERYHMTDFLNCVNAICIEDLGFPVSLFGTVQFLPEIKERILNDTLTPEFCELEPYGLISRAFYKYRRWQANGWKQKLCYEESRWDAFWSGVWAHLIKPTSI